MPYKLYLELKVLPKSLNKKLRSNRWRLHEENREWDMLVACECSSKKPKVPLLRAKISIVRHSHRTLDYDGLVGSLKPVVDALVTCGVLSDDSWNVTGQWNVDQKFRPKTLGPLLEIVVQQEVVPSSSSPVK